MGKKSTTDELVELATKGRPVKKTLNERLHDLLQAILNWLWNTLAPKLILFVLIVIAYYQIFAWFENIASDSDFIKYLIGGVMFCLIVISVERISTLFQGNKKARKNSKH